MADLKTTNIYGDAYINNKVGINTNAPATRLQIGQLTPSTATEGIQFGDDLGTRIYRSGTGTLTISGSLSVVSNFSSNGSLTSTYGSFTTPGIIIGDAQYGFYVSAGNVYYKSASGGAHYWRNKANNANTLTLDDSGNLTVTNDLFVNNQLQVKNDNPTITLSDTNSSSSFIHVNGNIFHILGGPPNAVFGGWSIGPNGRWPLEINLTNNNATFGGNVDAISFSGAGTGLTGTAANLTASRVTTNANLTGEVTSVGNATTITNGSIIAVKIATDAVTADKIIANAITNVKIADATIANAKLVNSGIVIGSTAISLGVSAPNLAGLTSVTSTTFTGALTGTATTASYANALNAANSYTGVNFTATGYFQTTTGFLRTDDANGIEILTTTNSAQSINVKGILIGSSYDTNPPQNEIRTSNNQSLVLNARGTGQLNFNTADASKMVILNSGNVGIGTTSPTGKLVVMGDDVFNYTKSSVPTAIIADDDVEFLIGSTDNIDGEEITLRLGTVLNTYYAYGAYIKAIQGSGVDYYKLAFGTSNGAVAATRMTIDNVGNVGIGTTSPGALLHVNNGEIWAFGATNERILLGDSTSAGQWGGFRWNTSVDNLQIVHSAYLSGATGAIEIVSSGNVGIGTTSPSGKLHISSTTTGATLLRTDGTNGTLFSVVDDLSDSLMSVNNSAGLPVLEVFADDRIVAGQYGQNDFVIVNNKVGIGTNNPSFKLDVTGSFGLNAGTSDGNWPFIVADTISSGGTNRYALNKIGAMGFNYADSYAQLQLVGSSGAYIDFCNSPSDDLDARIIYYANSRFDLVYGTTLTMHANGVGIGTTLPQALLHANGVISGSSFSGAGTGLTGTAASLTAGAATALTSMNISQFTNNSGYLTSVTIADGSITAAKLATDSVTTVKIVDANVTAAKLATDAVTTAKILNANVTNVKLANSSLTIGSTAIALGGTSTVLAGLTSVTSTAFTGSLVGTSSWASNVVNATQLGGVAATSYVTLTGTQTLTNKTITGTFTGPLTGNADTATNSTQLGGVGAASYVTLTGTQTLTNKTITGTFTGNLTGTADTANALTTVNSYTVANFTANGMTQLVGVKETYVDVNIASGVVTIDLNAGTVFRLNYNATVNSFTINNRTNNKVNSFTLISVAAAGAGGINFTFTANTLKWVGVTAPTATVTAGKIDVFSFIYDGTNWYGFVGGLNY